MLSCAGSFVHVAMVKAIFSTEKSRTNLLYLFNAICIALPVIIIQKFIMFKKLMQIRPFPIAFHLYYEYRRVISFHYSDGIMGLWEYCTF